MDLTETLAGLSVQNGDHEQSQKKRENYIGWTDYFMAVAFLAAKRSKDPHFQVGACIVNEDNRIVGVGYNGMPRGCSDDIYPWDKGIKKLYVCHAEMNAILNKNSSDVKNCTIYVKLFPCNECAKIIIQSGIKEVVYVSDKKAEKIEYKASRRMLQDAGVICTTYQRRGQWS
ncbi:deoxycytidylate deaminase-like isoform X2 [Achroia grisella]|uniref:deoxycytidylate deaminase-like isoform X2 n=1 Tax=Achroia grisella TaxID=688607 RepID=UPI0027D2A797|nr:deoxycytidylate deaminase-like isoform X2 [Achroia grisella]